MYGRGSARPGAAWSARESQALATLAALAQIFTPSAAHFIKSHQLLVQKFGWRSAGETVARSTDAYATAVRSAISGSVAGTVGRVQPFKDAIAQRSRPSWRRGYVPVTRLKRKDQRTGFRQSGCDRSTILTRARFQPFNR